MRHVEAGAGRRIGRGGAMTEFEPSKERGFTLTEVLVAAWVIGILAVIAFNASLDAIERAKLARCLAEVRGIQAAVWMDSNNGFKFMEPAKFWSTHYHSAKPGPYYYLLDGDANKGHGNDLDGIDEENPGASDPEREDIRFVVMCQHDHKWLCDYVYLIDDQPPRLVGGPDGYPDPGYDRFIRWEFGGPGGGTTN